MPPRHAPLLRTFSPFATCDPRQELKAPEGKEMHAKLGHKEGSSATRSARFPLKVQASKSTKMNRWIFLLLLFISTPPRPFHTLLLRQIQLHARKNSPVTRKNQEKVQELPHPYFRATCCSSYFLF